MNLKREIRPKNACNLHAHAFRAELGNEKQRKIKIKKHKINI